MVLTLHTPLLCPQDVLRNGDMRQLRIAVGGIVIAPE